MKNRHEARVFFWHGGFYGRGHVTAPVIRFSRCLF